MDQLSLLDYVAPPPRAGIGRAVVTKSPELDRPEDVPADCVGFDGEKIIIRFQYSPNLIQYLKMIGKANAAAVEWNKEGRYWEADKKLAGDIGHIDQLQRSPAFADLLSRVRAFQGCEESLTERIREALNRLPDCDAIGRKLFAHQTEGVRYLLQKMRCILADDMGLGKTLQSILAAKLIYEVATIPALIITRANLKDDWTKELTRQGARGYTVISWAKVPAEPPAGAFVLIADEAHSAQSFTSDRTKRFLKLARQAAAVWLLTGTPMPNGDPYNLCPLLMAIGHPMASKPAAFRQRFCRLKKVKFTPKDGGAPREFLKSVGAQNLDQLRVETQPFILRRLKSECLDLPRKTRIVRDIEPTVAQWAEWKQALADARLAYQNRTDKGEVASEGKALAIMNEMIRLASMAKVPETLTVAREIIDQGEKIVIFTRRVESCEAIAKALNVPAYHGKVKERREIMERFQTNDSVRAFVATGDSAGTGTTLTAASSIVLHDRPLRPGDVDQWEDRLNRIGQTKAVTSIWPTAFPIDGVIDGFLESKLEVIARVVDGVSAEEAKAGVISARQVIGKLL